MIKTHKDDLIYFVVNFTLPTLIIALVFIVQSISIYHLHKNNALQTQEMHKQAIVINKQDAKIDKLQGQFREMVTYRAKYELRMDKQLSNVSLAVIKLQGQVQAQKVQLARLSEQNKEFAEKISNLQKQFYHREALCETRKN